MSDMLVIEQTVTEDGTLVLHYPPGQIVPGQRVRVVIEPIQSETTDQPDSELDALLQGMSAYGTRNSTMGDVLQSDAIGIWENRADMQNPVAWLTEQRRQRNERRSKNG